ncbi:MAG: LysR family transcriptional regulator [Betaproteobacteria bacterium]|nr:LysR family transcriptional regulator [Betaproteobacteria bacterium]MCC7216810.1 LysR family transcriptional regulator [Burkholderiales bacterium]
MKLFALQALVAAVEEGSLRAAARRLGVSQPALTKVVRELERELNAPLVMRSTTGVTPTAQGKVIVDHARTVARELAAAAEEVRQLTGDMVGELTVAAVPLAVLLLIPETLRTFSREFPGIRLRISEEMYIAQLGKLRSGEVDIAVGPIPDSLPIGEFATRTLMPIQMAVVVRRGSPLAKAGSLRQLAEARWVYTSATGATGYGHMLFAHHGLPPPPAAAVVNSTLASIAVIGSGDYVGLMPMPIATHPAAAPFLAVVPIREGHLRLTIGAITKPETMLKPAARHFVSHLQRAASHARRG